MRYSIVILRRAKRDYAAFITYISRRSTKGAEAWGRAFAKALDRLRVSADACPLAEESDQVKGDIREAVFRTRRGLAYRILFTIRENTNEVVILRVRGAGQDFVDPLEIQDPD